MDDVADGKKVRRKVATAAKAIALTFIGVRLGVATIRLVGRLVRPKRAAGAGAASAQRGAAAQTTAHSEDVWNVVDAPAPATPEGYKSIVTTTLQCTPQELYSTLLSGQGSELYLQQHRELGRQWDLVVTGWRRAAVPSSVLNGPCGPEPELPAPAAGGAGSQADEAAGAADGSLLGPKSVFEYVVGQPGSGGFTRLLTFVNPRKPPSSIDTRCVQRQQMCVYRGDVVVFATATNFLDIPFKDCFTVNTLWRATPGPSPNTCNVTINLKVQFLKRAMGVGGIISASSFRETSAFYQGFMASVSNHLHQLRAQYGGGLPPLGLASIQARRQGSTPFAAAAAQGWPAGGSGSAAPLSATMPAWKQLRALLVFAVLALGIVHQLYLSQELASLKEGGAAAGGAVLGAGSVMGRGGVQAVLQALLGRILRPPAQQAAATN